MEKSPFESFEMQVTQTAQDFLRGAAGWAMFLSVVGFICVAFGLLAALSFMAMGSAFDNMPGGAGQIMSGIGLGLSTLIFVVIMFVPVLYLFKFSSSTRQALNENSTEGITKALGSLKSYFLWSGILTIIWIVSYIGFIIFAVSAAAAMGGAM